MTVDEQVQQMRQVCPYLRLNYYNWWTANWRGPIKGADQVYEISITYYRFRWIEGWWVDHSSIEVIVLSPALQDRDETWKGRVPHLYRHNFAKRGYNMLCLYDPDAAEWDTDQPIALTIVPWTAQWLLFYELWQATGQWTGPGRHPNEPVVMRQECKASKKKEIPKRFFTLGSGNYPGRRMLASEYYESAAAEYTAFYRRRCSPFWENGIWQTEASPTILTSSLEPLPADFSLAHLLSD